ncbi:MAG: XdhC family protein [Gemmatimonadota bacterium]
MDSEEEVYGALVRAGEEGRRVVLATVVAASGSTPRGMGSKMVIGEGGMVGTIGGGCGEADVLTAAEEVRETGRPKRVRLELMDDQESWSPAVCGGVMNVFLERVDP